MQYFLGLIVCFFIFPNFTSLATSFSVKGRILYHPDQSRVAGVPVVILKINPQGENPPLFPVGRSTTDEEGAYVFSDLDFEVGSRFQLGGLVDNQRLASEVFYYRGEDINFDFVIKKQLFDITADDSKQQSAQTTVITGHLQGALNLPGLPDEVFLQRFLLQENGEITSENIASIPLQNKSEFIFQAVTVLKNTAFKVGIVYKGVPILSSLFFATGAKTSQNLNIPPVSSDMNALQIKRDTTIFNVTEGGFSVAQFIYVLNPTSNIIELERPLIKNLPAKAINFSSPDADFNHVTLTANKLQLHGPFVPGERVIFFEYQLPGLLSYGNYTINWFASTEFVEFIYRKKDSNLRLTNIKASSKDIQIGTSDGYYAKQVDLAANSHLAGVEVEISSKFWSPQMFYIAGGLGGLVLIGGLGLFFQRWRANLKKSNPRLTKKH